MIETARALAREGRLQAYCSPLAFSEGELEAFGKRFDNAYGAKVVSLLRRRATPPEIASNQLWRTGTVSEILQVLGLRAGLPDAAFSLLTRNRAVSYDWAVRRRLSQDTTAIVGYQSTTQRTFELARRRGVPTVYDYPIPPWTVAQELMQEEARLVPEYAPTLQGHYFETWRQRRYDREIELADRLIMLSTYHQRTFESIGVPPERMFIAPLCVDLDLFTPAPELPDGTFRIAFVGQITQRKGISYLVEGFKRAELGDAELLFIGRPVGPRTPWINEPRVRHVPAVPRFMLPEILREAHVTAMPSILEGFGATSLEGMACGLPALVSENSMAHDVIEDGVDGWVLPIRDPDAVAERLRQLYDDRVRLAEMGRAARRKAEQYPWQRYRQAVLDGIAEVISQRG
jgi:glycosyltransferase involved in cell wall biosynthesis